MTQEELEFYNSLTPCWKREFNDYKSRHPEWGIRQLMNRISIGIALEGENCDEIINVEVDINNPKYLKFVLDKADGWMKRNISSNLYLKIGPVFKTVIKKLDDYIDMGLKFVQNLWKSICSFFD